MAEQYLSSDKTNHQQWLRYVEGYDILNALDELNKTLTFPQLNRTKKEAGGT